MKKRLLTGILAGALAVSAFAGCGSAKEENSTTTDNAAAKEETAGTEAAAEGTETATAVESKGTIKIAASATPHAEILEAAKPILAEEAMGS